MNVTNAPRMPSTASGVSVAKRVQAARKTTKDISASESVYYNGRLLAPPPAPASPPEQPTVRDIRVADGETARLRRALLAKAKTNAMSSQHITSGAASRAVRLDQDGRLVIDPRALKEHTRAHSSPEKRAAIMDEAITSLKVKDVGTLPELATHSRQGGTTASVLTMRRRGVFRVWRAMQRRNRDLYWKTRAVHRLLLSKPMRLWRTQLLSRRLAGAARGCGLRQLAGSTRSAELPPGCILERFGGDKSHPVSIVVHRGGL